VNAPGRLVDPSQFEDIVLRAQPDTALLRLGDIGHAQLGARPTAFNRVDGRDSGNLIVTCRGSQRRPDRGPRAPLPEPDQGRFPTGMDYLISYDSTMFRERRHQGRDDHAFEAIGLVILVVSSSCRAGAPH